MAIVVKRRPQTNLDKTPEFFSDFRLDFDVQPIKKDLVRDLNEEAIKSSIRNLLLTNRGERLYNKSIGSDIRSILFEPFSTVTESVLSDLIKITIKNFEPRADVQRVHVDSSIDDHAVYVAIVFGIINREAPVTLELILNRIR